MIEGPARDLPPTEPRFATARDFALVIFRYRTRIVTVFVTAVLTVFAGLSMISDKYDATSTILVQVGRENSAVPTTVMKEAFLQGGVHPEQLNSEAATLGEISLIAAAVDEIGLERFLAEGPRPTSVLGYAKWIAKKAYRGVRSAYSEVLYGLGLKKRLGDRDSVIALVKGNLRVGPLRDTNVLTVTLRLPDGQLGADVVNALVDKHLGRRAEYYGEEGALRVFQDVLDERRTALELAEADLARFRADTRISDMQEQRSIALGAKQKVEARIDEVASDVAQSEAEIAAYRDPLQKLPEDVSSQRTREDPVGESLAKQAADLRARRARLLAHYREDSRFITEVDDELASVERQMAMTQEGNYGSTTTAANPNRQALERLVIEAEAKLAGYKAQQAELVAQRTRIEERLDQYDELEARSRELERLRTVAEQALLNLHKKVDEARIVKEMEQRRLSNLVILSRATPPAEPASPQRMLIMGVGLAGSLLAALALAFASDFVDRSVRHGGDLERMGLPVLATVGEMANGLRPDLGGPRPREPEDPVLAHHP